ncbi:MAG: PAS domain S-box protein [Dehalococcoidia bacterium]
MPDWVLIALSALVLGVAASQAAVLVRGSTGRERRLWQALTVLLLVGALGRVVNALTLARSEAALPLSVQLSLLGNPAMVAALLALVRPTLRIYRRADERRRASDEAFRRSFTASRDPLAIIDHRGTYLDVNDAGLAFFRYRRDQVVGQSFRAFLLGDADPRGTVETALRSGVDRVEREILRGDGTVAPVESDLISLGGGRILVLGRDLSARRSAEADRLRLERLAAVHDLVGSVGADLRELLSFVKSSLELTDELGRDRVALDAPMAAVADALELVEEFTAVASDTTTDEPHRAAVDVRPMVEAAVEEHRRELDDRVELWLQPAAAPVLARVPSPAVRHIASVLIGQAVAATVETVHLTPPGRWFRGRVDVFVRRTAHDPEGTIEIVVEDNARPLDPALRASMFEPLGPGATPRRPALGATHALVLRLGGVMLVERWVDGGRAMVRLPGGSDEAG